MDLAKMIDEAQPRTVVKLKGTHRLAKRLIIDKPITLTGGTITGSAPGAIVELRANVSLNGVVIARTGGVGEVVIQKKGTLAAVGATFRGGKPPKGGEGSGLRCAGNAKLVRCLFENNFDGLLVEGKADVEAVDCVAKGNKNSGIAFTDNARGLVRRATITGGEMGLYFGDKTTATARDSTIDGSKYGVILRGKTTARLEKLTVRRSKEQGIAAFDSVQPTLVKCMVSGSRYQGLWWANNAGGLIESCDSSKNKLNGAFIADSANPLIRACKLHANQAQGILIGDTSKPRVEKCVAENNEVCGINVWEQATPVIVDNVCRGNGDSGILVSNDSRAVLERNLSTKNAVHGILIQDRARVNLRENQCRSNAQDGIAIVNKAVSELIANRCDKNGEDDLSFSDDVDESKQSLTDNRFKEVYPERYYVELGKNPPPLLARFGNWLAQQPKDFVGSFELVFTPLHKELKKKHPALATAVVFADTLRFDMVESVLALFENHVIEIPLEGTPRTVANQLGDFLHRLAAGKTGNKLLDHKRAKGRVALREWIRSQRIPAPKGALWDLSGLLGLG